MKKKKSNKRNSEKKSKEKNKNLTNRKIKRNSDLNNKNFKNLEINKRNRDDDKELKTQIIPELILSEDIINNINVTAYYQGKFICIFTSKDNILYLIYSKSNTIICYNLIDKKTMAIIKNAHPDYIRNFSHYLDKKKGIDLLISMSAQNLKVWNINTYENILSIDISQKTRKKFYLGCFINENDNINILTINKDYVKDGNFKYFNTFNILSLYGTNLESIKQNEVINYIDCYYNKKSFQNYIILGYFDKIQSYDYKNKKIYNVYNRSIIKIGYDYILQYINIIINDNDDLIKILASNYNFIDIWNFDSGILINKINVKEKIYSMGLWNDEFLFVGSIGNIILIDYVKGEIMENKIINDHNILPRITYIEKFENPLCGECLLSACGSLLKIHK